MFCVGLKQVCVVCARRRHDRKVETVVKVGQNGP